MTGQTNSPLGAVVGGLVTFAAVLSMIGLFIGNGLGGTRIPFALAADGMMPKFMVKVHSKHGTPWVSILIVGVIYSVFSLSAFQALVVIDVFLNMLVLLACFYAMWVMRFKDPDRPRQKVPGGWFGLTLITVLMTSIVGLAVVSNYPGCGNELHFLGPLCHVGRRRVVLPNTEDGPNRVCRMSIHILRLKMQIEILIQPDHSRVHCRIKSDAAFTNYYDRISLLLFLKSVRIIG